MSWDLVPGQHVDRAALHASFGGRIHPRISPSKQSPNVFLFVTPDAVASALDGWTGEHLYFGGEGGLDGTDQRLSSGNRSVLEHEQDNRALRVFLQPYEGPVRYLGQFRLDPQGPFVQVDAPFDVRRPQDVRKAFVFRLLPLNGTPVGLRTAEPVARHTVLQPTAPCEAGRAAPRRPEHTAAHKLLQQYERHERWERGTELTGYRIKVAGSVTELLVDLYDLAHNELVVARATQARGAVREAIGELHDLARYFTPEPARVLVLPARPDEDLSELLRRQQVTAVWPIGPHGFGRTDPSP
ncbi:hypothetical protein [Streptomyces clavuligerus]|uniref:hypothetical protein n=1 Tax=Streptomyces clavuligerus TaxID=1901 RepID=UPI0001800C67|nr:hypothetical protein [Streptomyces clavuligerus]EDY53112.1 hypothetical protein SSCG_05918 [Streptomyces clavuligerus]WDN56185.1 hypothetical protein LL058_30490 [Streptomyces clavuligerus]